jgi:hypothetical protein
MRIRITLAILALAAIGLAIAGPASAQTPRSDRAHGHHSLRVVVAGLEPRILV